MNKINIGALSLLFCFFAYSNTFATDDKKPENVAVLSGDYCHAISVACTAFFANPDIPSEKRDLKNYDVYVYMQDDVIRVSFITKRGKGTSLSEWTAHGDFSANSVGHSYLIDPRSFSVRKVIYDK
jgi:hypothetical protein